MSGNGAVWGRVRCRLRAFPERLAACGAEVRSRGSGQHLRDGAGGGALAGGGRGGCAGTHGPRGRGDPVPRHPSPGRRLRPLRAGVHGPGRPPEEGPVRAGVRGPAALLRRRGRWTRPLPAPRPAPPRGVSRWPPFPLPRSVSGTGWCCRRCRPTLPARPRRHEPVCRQVGSVTGCVKAVPSPTQNPTPRGPAPPRTAGPLLWEALAGRRRFPGGPLEPRLTWNNAFRQNASSSRPRTP